MAKEVVWTKIILETFLEESGILDRIELGDPPNLTKKNYMI